MLKKGLYKLIAEKGMNPNSLVAAEKSMTCTGTADLGTRVVRTRFQLE